MLEEVQNHIREAGMKAISDLKGDNIHTDFVENMLNVHKMYRELIQVILSTFKFILGVSKIFGLFQ